MEALFSKTINFNQTVKRNITNRLSPADAFSDLTDDRVDTDAAEKLINKTKHNINFSDYDNDFYYTAAINYPFETEPYMISRYSDGSFPIWYGSMDLETTIYETAYHAMHSLLNIDGLDINTLVTKKRAVFDVNCEGILFDFSKRSNDYPDLMANDYGFCQSIGKRLSQSGFPGFLSPSARYTGTNINVLLPEALTNLKLDQYLDYRIDLSRKSVTVNQQLTINY